MSKNEYLAIDENYAKFQVGASKSRTMPLPKIIKDTCDKSLI